MDFASSEGDAGAEATFALTAVGAAFVGSVGLSQAASTMTNAPAHPLTAEPQ